MISKFPRWVWIAAWFLSFVGGAVNVLGFLGFAHQAITHLTGTTSVLSASIVQGDLPASLHLSASISSFVAGCALGAMVVRAGALEFGRRYLVGLLLEASLLLVSIPLLKGGILAGLYTASFACGLQNAMASTYSGAVVRTTHVSGMFTDLGIYLGHTLRGLPVDTRRLRMCLVVICGFLCGGMLGAWGFRRIGYDILLVPVFVILGLAVIAWQMRIHDEGLNGPLAGR